MGADYKVNPHAGYRRMPEAGMTGDELVDVIDESGLERLSGKAVLEFIGPAIITHWRYSAGH